jgi:sulfur-carrier protein
MQIRIEFFGIARSRAGVSAWMWEVATAEKITLDQALHAVGEQFPGLLGECIVADRPAPGYTVNLNGERFVREPYAPLQNGDCLLLLSADAGG